jgi:hypothetical protein
LRRWSGFGVGPEVCELEFDVVQRLRGVIEGRVEGI